jgi:hypothetical protein
MGMAAVIHASTRAEARTSIAGQVVAASVVLRHAVRHAVRDVDDVLDPLEMLELSELIRRTEAFGVMLAAR